MRVSWRALRRIGRATASSTKGMAQTRPWVVVEIRRRKYTVWAGITFVNAIYGLLRSLICTDAMSFNVVSNGWHGTRMASMLENHLNLIASELFIICDLPSTLDELSVVIHSKMQNIRAFIGLHHECFAMLWFFVGVFTGLYRMQYALLTFVSATKSSLLVLPTERTGEFWESWWCHGCRCRHTECDTGHNVGAGKTHPTEDRWSKRRQADNCRQYVSGLFYKLNSG